MERPEIEILQLELKYCERCGGLWLRLKGRCDVYCASCALAMTDVTARHRSRRPARLPVNRPSEFQSEALPEAPSPWESGNA